MNVELAKIIAPTDVQKGDTFEITAFVQAQGRRASRQLLELVQKGVEDSDASVVDYEDRSRSPATASRSKSSSTGPRREPGTIEYTVRVKPQGAVIESREDDNLQTRTINIFDRPMKILIVAGGPMRDYRFVRNLLHRHPRWMSTSGSRPARSASARTRTTCCSSSPRPARHSLPTT